MKDILKDIIELNKSIAIDYLNEVEYPWDIISNLEKIIIDLGNKLDKNKFQEIMPNVWVHKSAKVDKTAKIIGPCIIDENALIGFNTLIRNNVIIGKKCVVGNSSEVKNSILFDESSAPHFNYVGDSIIGYKAHFGAGSLTSNFKSDQGLIKIKINGIVYNTNLNKLGVIVGDNVEIGCNSVLNPGTVIGCNSTIYPLTMIRGEIRKNKIVKDINNIVDKNIK